jgi:hypothetical protein
MSNLKSKAGKQKREARILKQDMTRGGMSTGEAEQMAVNEVEKSRKASLRAVSQARDQQHIHHQKNQSSGKRRK